MSTLVIDTIQGKTTAGSVNVRGEGSNNTNLQQGLAKVWSLWNSSGTPAHRDSFNCGSITDHGTGDQSIAFTTNMSSADNCVSGTADGNNAADTSNSQIRPAQRATSSQRFTVQYASGGTTALYDYTHVSGIIYGDLA